MIQVYGIDRIYSTFGVNTNSRYLLFSALQVTDITEILNNFEFEDSGDDEDFIGCLITTDDRSDAAQSSEDEDSSDSDDDSNLPEVRAGSSGVGRTTAGRRGRGRRRAGARVRTRGGTRSLGPSRPRDVAPCSLLEFLESHMNQHKKLRVDQV